MGQFGKGGKGMKIRIVSGHRDGVVDNSSPFLGDKHWAPETPHQFWPPVLIPGIRLDTWRS